MIEGVVGLPGAGKTLWTVKRMLEAVKKKRRVVANFPSTKDLWETELWIDMVEEYQAWCVIDEAQMWFSAREWSKTKQVDLGVFQQHRKNGLDLTWIAQHENRVDVGLREITAFIWRVGRIGNWLIARRFTPDDMKTVYGWAIWHINKAVFAEYDTYQIIGDREGHGARRGKGPAAPEPAAVASVTTRVRELVSISEPGRIVVRWADQIKPELIDENQVIGRRSIMLVEDGACSPGDEIPFLLRKLKSQGLRGLLRNTG